MEGVSRLGRIGGVGLAVGGVGFFLTGALHPQGEGQDLSEVTASMLQSSAWSLAHWLALATGLLLAWVVWLLVDVGWTQGSVMAQAGGRLAIVSGLFMTVQFAAEVAARSEVEALAAGQGAPLVNLVESMQAVGWPAWMLGLILLAVGVAGSAPRLVVIAGVAGAVAMALAGILVEGLGIIAAGPLFMGGNLVAIWMVWAGVRLVRGRVGGIKDGAVRTMQEERP